MLSKASHKRAAGDDYDEGDGFVAGPGSDVETGMKPGKEAKRAK